MAGRPAAAAATRTALDAIDVWNPTMASTAVSTSWASASGAVIERIGSLAKTGVPSSIAQTSPVNLNRAR